MLQCLESYEIVSPRMLTAKFKMKEGILNIIQVYAPTSAYSESEIDAFYDILQLHIEKIPKKESVIVMGISMQRLEQIIMHGHQPWVNMA